MIKELIRKEGRLNILVTGGVGFIGSHLVEALLKRGDCVTVYDNFSTGKKEFLKAHQHKDNFRLVKKDLLDFPGLSKAMENQESVFHLAANPNIKRSSMEDTKLDLEQGVLVTYNVLEAMRLKEVKNIVFTSSSVVYGEAKKIPTPEDYAPLMPISLYGASKLACEGLISSYCHLFNIQGWIFRFANIVGKNATHGVIVDFFEKLRRNPAELEILGNGRQCKSFLLVEQCVEAILFALEKSQGQLNIFNIGSGDNIKVSEIAQILVQELGLKDVRFKYTGGERGWKGDVPLMLLSVEKINKLGWKAKYNSQESVRLGIESLLCRQ